MVFNNLYLENNEPDYLSSGLPFLWCVKNSISNQLSSFKQYKLSPAQEFILVNNTNTHSAGKFSTHKGLIISIARMDFYLLPAIFLYKSIVSQLLSIDFLMKELFDEKLNSIDINTRNHLL
jgi:hypothetical protein